MNCFLFKLYFMTIIPFFIVKKYFLLKKIVSKPFSNIVNFNIVYNKLIIIYNDTFLFMDPITNNKKYVV